MKSIYKKYFYVPSNGKVREKVLLARVAVTIGIILVCLAAMSYTAYAYFTCNVSSSGNIIRSANFEVETVIKSGTEEITVTKTGILTSEATLEKGKEYTVTLKMAGTASTGFCEVTAEGNNVKYTTTQLIAYEQKDTEELTFKLTVSNNTKIKITSNIGTSVKYVDYTANATNTEDFIIENETVGVEVQAPSNLVSEPETEDNTPESNEEEPEETQEPPTDAADDTDTQTENDDINNPPTEQKDEETTVEGELKE